MLLPMFTLLRLVVIVLALLCGSLFPAWAQSDGVSVSPVVVDVEGDGDGRLLDTDARFAPQALLELAQAGDDAALRALLVETPSSYAATRGLILNLLGDASAQFLHDYAFEAGQVDPALSALELTALLNSALGASDLAQLARSARVLLEPELVGAGAAAEDREFAFIALMNEVRLANATVRQRVALSAPLNAVVEIGTARKEALLEAWLGLRLTASGETAIGLSQLLTLVALDDDASISAKQQLLNVELGVPVGEGFTSAQYGAIYVVLKALPAELRDQLRRVVTLDVLSPSTSPLSDIAGLYTGRQIGLKVSLTPDAMAGVLEHEVGHLAWDTLLTFQQRSQFGQLHNQSRAGTLDFVSNYAQTNASEDYAETFQMYMQDTVGWIERSEKSQILRQKLAFAAIPLAPYAFETVGGLIGPQVRRAAVSFQNGLPNVAAPLVWETL